jgi:hypothetical protein
MHGHQLIYPMFTLVLLTFVTLVRMFRVRYRLVAEGKMKASYFKLYQDGPEPEASAKLARHFSNLFEAPVLFYAACLAAMATGAAGTAFVALAWAYVLLRVAHAWIHTGANPLWPRIYVYFASWVVLLLLWTLLVTAAATRGPA